MSNISVVLQKAETSLESYTNEITEYLENEGNDNSEYLIHRRLMQSYYRGLVHAYKKVQETLDIH